MLKYFISFIILYISFVYSSELIEKSNFIFPEISILDENYLDHPCSPLSDIWGFDQSEESFAVVGVSNGISIVNVTNSTNPYPISYPYNGCITEWRDMKTFHNYLYVVNDHTATCDCSEEQQPCQQEFVIQYGVNQSKSYRASEGHAQAPLQNFPNGVSGLLVYPASDPTACSPLTEDLTDKIAFIDRGNCSFTTKTLNAQQANASSIIIIDTDQSAIYPSMSGNNSGILIPGLLIGINDGNEIKSIMSNESVTGVLDYNNRVNSSLYKGPDGWYILDISDPSAPIVSNTNEFFDFAHNILVDPLGRNLSYVCGQSSNSFSDIGGVIVFDISDPIHPQLIANFSTAYIHDIEVVSRNDGSIVLYGCAIYDGLLYVINVTDPWTNSNLNDQIISITTTIDSPHNTAQTEDGAYLYITHEEFSFPVTIWNSTNLSNLVYLNEFSVNPTEGTSPHNAMVNGNELWMSYYSEGVLVYDITNDPAHPELLGEYDTSSYDNGFHGVWGIYPYTPSGNLVYASDIESGLWILELIEDETTSTATPTPIMSPTSTNIPITASDSSHTSFQYSTQESSEYSTNIETSGYSTEGQSSGYITDAGSSGYITNDGSSGAGDTGGDSGDDSNFYIYIIIAVVILAIVVIIVLAIIAGYFVYKKRVGSGTAVPTDDFDGRVDEDDLF